MTDDTSANTDPRFKMGLMFDITQVLRAHGYQQPDGEAGNAAMGSTVQALWRLVEAYEGRAE